MKADALPPPSLTAHPPAPPARSTGDTAAMADRPFASRHWGGQSGRQSSGRPGRSRHGHADAPRCRGDAGHAFHPAGGRSCGSGHRSGLLGPSARPWPGHHAGWHRSALLRRRRAKTRPDGCKAIVGHPERLAWQPAGHVIGTHETRLLLFVVLLAPAGQETERHRRKHKTRMEGQQTAHYLAFGAIPSVQRWHPRRDSNTRPAD